MYRLHRVDDATKQMLRHVGVAIKAIDGEQRHLAIMHGSDNSLSILHLAWHHDLRNEDLPSRAPRTDYVWADPNVDERRLRQVAAYCRKVWRANTKGEIPYGFSPPNDILDQRTGQLLIGPTRHGLTCATFVLAVFHGARVQIVDYRTWPIGRREDVEWQETIAKTLKRHGAAPDHVAAVRDEIGAARFHPEEVAAAAICKNHPTRYPDARKLGNHILRRLDDPNYCPGLIGPFRKFGRWILAALSRRND